MQNIQPEAIKIVIRTKKKSEWEIERGRHRREREEASKRAKPIIIIKCLHEKKETQKEFTNVSNAKK